MGFAFKLINDPAFKDLKYTVDSTMKACTAQGIDISVCKAEVLTVMSNTFISACFKFESHWLSR